MKFKICFDLDNTICTTVKNFYSKSKPKKRVINLINNLNPKKYEVIILLSQIKDAEVLKPKEFNPKIYFLFIHFKENFNTYKYKKPQLLILGF